jgi:TRAP-type C4-dicarboxylate transport system permease large subunit
MKKYFVNILVFFPLVAGLSSCEAIGGIFKAGVWSGILLIVLIVAVIIIVATKFTKRK